MIHFARIISCYAADTSGVCSALYELGGMTVIHDASGCNSTYTTHDEPRWYDMDSMIFVSGLTEIDAVMGNDERLINDVCEAAKELEPRFISLCGSPMPAMNGTDFDAVASVCEQRSGTRTFAFHTNGMHDYLFGASEAFERICDEYMIQNESKKNGVTVNIFGCTPLDFARQEIINSIEKWLRDSGFEVGCTLAMGSDFEKICNGGNADCNLVISYSGLAAAKTMHRKFGTPFVCGVPIGEEYSKLLAEEIRQAISYGENIFSCADRKNSYDSKIAVVGEGIVAGSLAKALELERGTPARVICPLSADDRMFCDGDKRMADEVILQKEFAGCDMVIADMLFKPICNDNDKTSFYPLAHPAFSGRCYEKTIPNMINKRLELKK